MPNQDMGMLERTGNSSSASRSRRGVERNTSIEASLSIPGHDFVVEHENLSLPGYDDRGCLIHVHHR